MRTLALVFVMVSLLGGASLAGGGCCSCERIVIQGQILKIKHPIALVAGEDGKTYRVRLGPYWYWKEKGYRLKEGLFVRVVGLKRGQLIFPITIETQGRRILIRDERGLPLWRHK